MPVYNFNSITDFAKRVALTPQSNRWTGDAEAKSWTGETYAESLHKSRYGDPKYAERAAELLDKLYTEIDIPFPTYQASMYGAFPVVGDFLANSPTPMRKRTMEETPRNPITIYYDISSSAGHKWEDLVKRGTAVLALAMVLQKMRPVNLKLVATLDGQSSDKCTLPVIGVDLNNVNLSLAAYATASTGFDRNLIHTWAKEVNGFSGHWAWFEYPQNPDYWKKLERYLKMQPEDMLIKGAFLTDELIVKDPIAWCKQEIERFKIKAENNFDDGYNENYYGSSPKI